MRHKDYHIVTKTDRKKYAAPAPVSSGETARSRPNTRELSLILAQSGDKMSPRYRKDRWACVKKGSEFDMGAG